MITETILGEFIAAIFKNTVLKKQSDILLEQGIEKLKSIFIRKKKESLLSELRETEESPKAIAEKKHKELNELLQEKEFKSTALEMYNHIKNHKSLWRIEMDAKEEITIEISGEGKSGADNDKSIRDSIFKSTEGSINIKIT